MKLLLALLTLASLGSVGSVIAADDLARLEQQALNAAAEAVAESVVQIRTVGGLDRVEQQAAAQGPTTGLIVDAGGYIVSSAFNFAQEPTSILVRLPSGEQRPAEIVGRDNSRMLVLLKVEADDPLPVPEAAPMQEVRPGDWAVAVGRTYDEQQVNISVGVVSGLNRMHGRALQTDANVSVSNYGGPLVDIHGRVLGVLVPMAPQSGGGETSAVAGSEFYDSGIGFAVPLEHVFDVLDRWKKENNLHRGLLGVSLQPGNPHAAPPTVIAVWPRSPAAAAGWKPKDRIISVDDEPVESQTDLRFHIATHYAGDKLAVTIRRGKGDDTKEVKTTVTLSDELPAYQHAFLGILPERTTTDEADQESDNEDNAKAEGVAVRAVWPDGPADEAGVKPGDRITRLGSERVQTIGEAVAQLNAKSPEDQLALKLTRGDEELEFDVELGKLPTEVLSSTDLPAPDNADASDADDAKLEELKLPEMSQISRYLDPGDDGPPRGLVLWLGRGGEEAAQALMESWQRTCRRDRLVLLMPDPADAAGWSRDDLEYLARLLQTAVRRFEADPRRIIVAGEGKGGQLAYAFAFGARKLVRGVVAVDSPLPRTLELPDYSPNERLAILTIESPDTPLSILMRQDGQKLAEAGYPATQLTRRGDGDAPAPLDSATRAKVARWIDALDRF
jgi:serine protease Do